jgi:hypothetical protein
MSIPHLALGDHGRSTAKKFLAAANFLELLSVFDVPDQSEVRYDLSDNPHCLKRSSTSSLRRTKRRSVIRSGRQRILPKQSVKVVSRHQDRLDPRLRMR